MRRSDPPRITDSLSDVEKLTVLVQDPEDVNDRCPAWEAR